MLSLKKIFADAFHIFYPHICCGCGNDLPGINDILCLKCILSLPHTNFEQYAGNPIEKMFQGRFSLTAAHSEFHFSKGQLIQELIHELKYKGNKDIGIFLGKMTGRKLIAAERFSGIDLLVPLPMFPAKEFKRGYNQATIICNGMSEAMNIPVLNNNIIRLRRTETQTKKHRIERWENVAESFAARDPVSLQGKHILLVDDVLTTGATLDACCQVMQPIPGISISIATLAIASK